MISKYAFRFFGIYFDEQRGLCTDASLRAGLCLLKGHEADVMCIRSGASPQKAAQLSPHSWVTDYESPITGRSPHHGGAPWQCHPNPALVVTARAPVTHLSSSGPDITGQRECQGAPHGVNLWPTESGCCLKRQNRNKYHTNFRFFQQRPHCFLSRVSLGTHSPDPFSQCPYQLSFLSGAIFPACLL